MDQDAPRDPPPSPYSGGECHTLTLVLHALTGWQVLTLHDGRIGGCDNNFPETDSALVHSGVLSPDGHFVDAAGKHHPDRWEAIADHFMHYPWDWARWNYGVEMKDLFEAVFPREFTDEDMKIVNEQVDVAIEQVIPNVEGMRKLFVSRDELKGAVNDLIAEHTRWSGYCP